MDDYRLIQQQDWRYCRVRAGEKTPYPRDWQRQPLELWQVDSENIGLLLGPASNGTCAIDFDGPSAFDWLQEQNIDLLQFPKTPIWSSGRSGRCQMAFRVPVELWDILTTKKIVTRQPTAPGRGDGEGFEFRWTGSQSVIPPSRHPSGRFYQWEGYDAMQPVADIPLDLLELWGRLLTPRRREQEQPEVNLEDLNEARVEQVNLILTELKSRKPVLMYDDWRSVAWGVAKELGREAGEVIMREYYPEQEPGEYRNLYRNYDVAKSPSMGTVRRLAEIKTRRQQHNERFEQYLEQQRELHEIEQRLQKMKKDLQNDRNN